MTWSDSYIMATISMPIYWFLVLVPALIKNNIVVKASSDIIAVNSEPRAAGEEFMSSEHAKAGLARRALGAHLNGWENFIVFLSAALTAQVSGVNHSLVNTMCLITVISRFFYNVMYLGVAKGPLSFARSFCFIVGIGASVTMWVAAIIKTA